MMPDVPDRSPLVGPLVELIDYVATERTGRTPDEASPAHVHLDHQAGFAGEWGLTPVQEALNGIGLFLAAAEDHLRSMSVLLVNYPPSTYGPVVLARAGLEAACKAWWMLEPGIAVEQFVCRHMSEQLKSLHEQLRLPPSAIDEADLRNRYDAILRTAAEKGVTPHVPGPRDRWAPYLDEAWPSMSTLVRRVLGETLGAGLYKFFSAVTHATSYSLPWLADMDGTQQIGADAYLADVVLPPPIVRQLVMGGGFSYMKGVRRMYQLYGWPNGALENLIAVALSAYETWPRASKP